MRTAVLISGDARTFGDGLDNLHWMVLRHYMPGADFFVSAPPSPEAAAFDRLRERYPEAQVEIDTSETQPTLPLPAGCPTQWTKGRPYTHEPYAISVGPQAVVGQLWRLGRCWALYERTRKREHDCVIRLRPDLWFHEFTAKGPDENEAFVASWGGFGGINDRFAVMGWRAARAYFGTFDRLGELWRKGCPIHPESLIAASLEMSGVSLTHCASWYFSRTKADGSREPPEIHNFDLIRPILLLAR